MCVCVCVCEAIFFLPPLRFVCLFLFLRVVSVRVGAGLRKQMVDVGQQLQSKCRLFFSLFFFPLPHSLMPQTDGVERGDGERTGGKRRIEECWRGLRQATVYPGSVHHLARTHLLMPNHWRPRCLPCSSVFNKVFLRQLLLCRASFYFFTRGLMAFFLFLATVQVWR